MSDIKDICNTLSNFNVSNIEYIPKNKFFFYHPFGSLFNAKELNKLLYKLNTSFHSHHISDFSVLQIYLYNNYNIHIFTFNCTHKYHLKKFIVGHFNMSSLVSFINKNSLVSFFDTIAKFHIKGQRINEFDPFQTLDDLCPCF